MMMHSMLCFILKLNKLTCWPCKKQAIKFNTVSSFLAGCPCKLLSVCVFTYVFTYLTILPQLHCMSFLPLFATFNFRNLLKNLQLNTRREHDASSDWYIDTSIFLKVDHKNVLVLHTTPSNLFVWDFSK